MLEVAWRPLARRQFESTVQYIRDRDVAAARRMEAAIQASVERLRAMPLIGRPGRVTNTREWIVHPNYLIIYSVEEDVLTVLRVLHARQRYP